MYSHTRSSWCSARSAAKCATCGLNAHTRSAVASTIAQQNCSIASGAPSSGAGISEGSGSRPTQSIDPDASQALASLAWRPNSVLDGDRSRGAQVGRLDDLRAQLLAGLLLEDVEVAVAAHLEHFGTHLHAAAGGSAHVVVDDDSHDFPSLVVAQAWRR